MSNPSYVSVTGTTAQPIIDRARHHLQGWVARRGIEITTGIAGDGEVARRVHVVKGLHGVLKPPDAGALRDEVDDTLRRQILRAQLVADVATQAPRVVAEAVAARVRLRGRADGWA